MERLTLELEFVTPCFLGGPARDGSAEWRGASVRGQLRWWLRAVAGGRTGGDLARVREIEAEIFGTTDRGSALMVRALGAPRVIHAGDRCSYGEAFTAQQLAEMWRDPSPKTVARLLLKTNGGSAFKTNPVQYLAYGPVVQGQFVRSAILPEQKAKLEIRWRRKVSGEARELFDLALWGWLNLGGIGGRSRKGFGSVRCLEVQRGASRDPQWKEKLAPIGMPALRSEIERWSGEMKSAATSGTAEWSHFSAGSRVYLGTDIHSTWQDAMNHLGAWLMAYRRRYGQHTDSRVYAGTALADRDYEWAKRGGRHAQVPDRAGFGLPLTFRFRGAGESSVKLGGGGQDGPPPEARRASPLLLHVAMFAAGAYCPVLTYLPARLIPPGGKLQLVAGGGHPKTSPSAPTPGQERVVQRFLDDLEGKQLIERVE